MLQSLRKQLTRMCVAASTVILCLMAAVSLTISERDFVAGEREAFGGRVDGLVLYLRSNDVIDTAYIARYEMRNALLAHIEDNGAVLLQAGQSQGLRAELLEQLQHSPVFTAALQDWADDPSPASGHRSVLTDIADAAGNPYHAGVVELRSGSATMRLYVFGDTARQRTGIARRRAVFIGAVLAAALLLAAFSWWFSGRAVAPVAKSRQSQSEFIAAVSHEMRTPLAAIRNSLEAMRIAESEQDRARFSHIIDRECARATQLVGDMLTLTSIDTQGWSIRRGPVETAELIQEAVMACQPAGAAKDIRWQVQLPKALPLLTGDADRLNQVLCILLDNAVRYTPPGGQITVRAAVSGQQTHLYIADSGPGMTDEQKAEAFLRFYRADRSRSDKEHYGLGLSIAWELVRLHGGRIELADTPGGGLTAHITLSHTAPG